jgi:hypothetical protein
MKSYRVSFFKNLLSPDGHRFKCVQRIVEIHRAKSIERAVLAAKHRYARIHSAADWTLHADGFEVKAGSTIRHPKQGDAKMPQLPPWDGPSNSAKVGAPTSTNIGFRRVSAHHPRAVEA